jgi:hypothetical protein
MLREGLRRSVGVGLVEPAADRYQVDYGAYAEMYFDGQLRGGPSGAPLRPGNRGRRAKEATDDPLGLLGQLRAVTQAQYCGEEMLRGTPCRVVAVRAGSAAFTVWIDDEHVRRIEYERGLPRGGSAKTTRTFELWDFGVQDGSLDWSHLPSFRSPG